MLKKFFCFLAMIYSGCCFYPTHLYSNDQKIMIAVDAYFGPPNNSPIITNLFVTESSGNISILYDLFDNESALCTVALEYAEAGSELWYPASISGAITDITPDTGLEIIWNSAEDLPDINGEFVSLRLRAHDGILWGDWDTLEDVFVINTYVIFQISYFNVFDPHINNRGSVVWRGDLYDNTIHIASDIYLFNTVTTLQLTDFNYFAASPKINDNGAIIWAASDGEGGLHSTGTDTEIYLYDGQTISRLTDNNYDDLTPALNNENTTVWAGWDGADYEIFMYNGISVQQITSNAADDINPQINDSTTVVWMGWDGADYEIFMYDTASVIQLTDNALPDNDARINNSGDIVWSGFDGTDWEIYLYRNGIITQITDNAIDDIQPQLSSNGTVVWAGGSASNKDIYYYDGISIVQVSSSAIHDTQPQINGSGVIVWSGSDGASDNIYIFDGTALTNLTHDQYRNITPQINDKSYIVWNRWNGTFWEIMLAYPRTPYSIEIISISEAAGLIGLTWAMNPPYAPFTIYWSPDLDIWDSINGPALNDIYINIDGTKTWYDTGSDPDMGGLAPSAVEKRLYKIIIEE